MPSTHSDYWGVLSKKGHKRGGTNSGRLSILQCWPPPHRVKKFDSNSNIKCVAMDEFCPRDVGNLKKDKFPEILRKGEGGISDSKNIVADFWYHKPTS